MMKTKSPVFFLFRLFVAFAPLLGVSCGGDRPSETPVASPTAADTTRLLVMQVNRCARLYTTSYHVHKIVTHEDVVRLKGSVLSQSFDVKVPMGERKVAIPIDVTLKAYIDFAGFSAENVERNGRLLVLTLPDPRIVVTASKVDHAGTRQYVDFSRSRYSDAELSDFARQGADSITAHIDRYGLVESARQTAVQTLIPMLRRMGYEESDIIIRFRKDFTPRELQRLITVENHPES